MPSRFRVPPAVRQRIIFFAIILLLAGSVRFLTFRFMREHLNDPGWFQYGSYRVFDKRANEILDGGRLFWIDDPSRTDLIQYPPAYPWMVAAIYRLAGQRSIYAVQTVQSVLDLILTMVLLTGVAVTAYGWPTGMAAAAIAAMLPLLAFVGVAPSSDAPTTWFVIGGLWLALLAAKRGRIWWAFGAGAVLGIACWFRVNPLYLSLFWALPFLLNRKTNMRARMLKSAAMLLGTLVVIAPIVIRNYAVFPDFTPTGGTLGANLWEGLGETELGRQNGFALGDDKMIERERIKMGLASDFPIEAMWPDGIKRERERTRESLVFIRQHPVWYAGVMARRMWGMLKIAGKPEPYYGTAGINVTSRKCLPLSLQSTLIAIPVNALGMLQSVLRYLLLPLAALGLWFAFRKDWLMTLFLFLTMFYYLVPGSVGHTEMRYVMPVHWILAIFAGLTLVTLGERIRKWRQAATVRN